MNLTYVIMISFSFFKFVERLGFREVLLFRTLTILDGNFLDFLQSLEANSGTVPRLGCDHFLPSPFQFINPTIRLYVLWITTVRVKLSL
jgi:hypothetical protein